MNGATIAVKRWIAALESGDYKQGHQRLRSKEFYCCLGVACDLHSSGYWCGNVYYIDGYSGPAFTHLPPFEVIAALGFEVSTDTLTPGANINFHGETVSDWNDEDKFTFAEIAARLRERCDLVGVDLTIYYTPKKGAVS